MTRNKKPDAPQEVPDELAEALTSRYQPQQELPASLREQLQAQARSQIASSTALRQKRFLPGRWRAAAAVLLLGLSIYGALSLSHSRGLNKNPQLARLDISNMDISSIDISSGDLDSNGIFDIRDALRLASTLDQHSSNLDYDFNKDGEVNQFDVDVLGERAVAITKKGKRR